MRKGLIFVLTLVLLLSSLSVVAATDDSNVEICSEENEDPSNEVVTENYEEQCDSNEEQCSDNNDVSENTYYPPCNSAIIDSGVWNDSNENGIQDNDEKGIANVTVNLWSGDEQGPITQIATTKTAEDGRYTFTNLAKGIYWLQFIAPESAEGTWIFSPQDQGDNDCKDSDANVSGIAGPIYLCWCECESCWDAGLIFVAAAGGENETPETPNEGAAGGEEITEVTTVSAESVPLQETGTPLLPGILAALLIGGGLIERKLRK